MASITVATALRSQGSTSGSSRPTRTSAADRARLREAEAALGSLPRGGSRCYSGDPLLPEELDVLSRLGPAQLQELVRQPKSAEPGDVQASLVLVDPQRISLPHVAIGPASVLLHVYNLSESVVGANALLAFSMDRVAVGGVFHVGLEVYGSEYAYGVCGVSHLLPRAEEGHVYQCTVYLGETHLSHDPFADVLGEMCRRWSGADYDVLGRNCCCFCAQMLERLGVGPMPLWVDRFSRLLLSGREAGREALLASVQRLLEGGALVQRGLDAWARYALSSLGEDLEDAACNLHGQHSQEHRQHARDAGALPRPPQPRGEALSPLGGA